MGRDYVSDPLKGKTVCCFIFKRARPWLLHPLVAYWVFWTSSCKRRLPQVLKSLNWLLWNIVGKWQIMHAINLVSDGVGGEWNLHFFPPPGRNEIELRVSVIRKGWMFYLPIEENNDEFMRVYLAQWKRMIHVYRHVLTGGSCARFSGRHATAWVLVYVSTSEMIF